MMQKIKYRVYHNSNVKKDSGFLSNHFGLRYSFQEEMFCLDAFFDREPAFFIQQFTGLLDKNGKEIYEGDICLYTPPEINIGVTSCYFEIYWKENGFFASNDKINISWMLDKDFCSNNLQIVGNIFENKELLEK